MVCREYRSFNPRPREGGDDLSIGPAVEQLVSIRAPARGATTGHSDSPSKPKFQSAPPRGGRLAVVIRLKAVCVFQSAPPRGGRLQLASVADIDDGFNPRPREGGDLAGVVMESGTWVSIRAPARGATACGLPTPRWSGCFNPRPREGGDLPAWQRRKQRHSFNPRPREGGDNKPNPNRALTKFQSAPPRGGRRPTHRATGCP